MHIKLGLSLTALIGSAALLIGTLAACSTPPKPLYSQEQFATGTSPFAHDFKGSPAATCEAARRALLSQGYITTSSRFDAVDGSKNFQPDNDSHVVIEFHVVCAPGDVGEHSTVYVNALQDRYVLKKSSTNASVGLSVFGSLSLPIGSSDDAMVKVASETIPAGLFYERYFGLLTYYLDSAPDKTTPTAATPKPRALPLPPVKAPEPAPALVPQAQVAPTAVTPPMPLPPAAVPAAASAAFTPDHVFVVPPVTTVGHGSTGAAPAASASAAAAQSASSAAGTAATHAAAPVTASVPAAASAATAASASGAAPGGASAPAAASAPTGGSAPAAAIPASGPSAATAAASAVGVSAPAASVPSVATSAPNETSASTTTASAIGGASVPTTAVPNTTTGPSDAAASAATSTLTTATAQPAQPSEAAQDSSNAPAK